MHYRELIQTIYDEPWLITPAGHSAIKQIADRQDTIEKYQSREANLFGEKIELPGMTVNNGIASIPITGMIGMNLGIVEKLIFGATDVDDIAKELRQAEADDEVEQILLEFDSPGGMVKGTPELANSIRSASKPVSAFTRGSMASGAYWLAASAATEVVATPTASIGSIGVYIPFIDVSQHFEDMGIKVNLFRSGKFKGMGFPGTSLTDEQAQMLQDRVDSIFELFASHVRRMRGAVDYDTMQGQVFLGEEAADRNLVDDIVQSRDEMLDKLTS